MIVYIVKVASTTLDASAKIYAGRVDAIHAETYKVLSGLGRGSEKQKQVQGNTTVDYLHTRQGFPSLVLENCCASKSQHLL